MQINGFWGNVFGMLYLRLISANKIELVANMSYWIWCAFCALVFERKRWSSAQIAGWIAQQVEHFFKYQAHHPRSRTTHGLGSG